MKLGRYLDLWIVCFLDQKDRYRRNHCALTIGICPENVRSRREQLASATSGKEKLSRVSCVLHHVSKPTSSQYIQKSAGVLLRVRKSVKSQQLLSEGTRHVR